VARRIFAVSVGSVATLIAAAALLRGVLTERLRATSALMAPPLELDATFAHALGSGMVSLVVAVVVSGLFLRSAHSRWGRIAVPCAIAIYALHSGWEAWTITPVAPAHQFTEVPGLLRRAAAAAATDRPPPRVYRSPVIDAEILPEARPTYSHQTLYLDSAGRFGFAAVPGFEGWRSPGFAALRSRAAAMSLDSFLTLYAIDYVALPSEVRQELFPVGGRPQGTISELELGFAAARPEGTVAWSLIPVERTRPRAFVAPRWRWASAGGALDDALRPDRAEDAGLVVLEGDGAAGGAAGRLTPCALAGYRPEKVDLECDSGGGYAVVAGENAPGWSATVDGAAAPIITADVLLRAVRVERGRHRVRFSYRTPLLRTGVAVSAIAWLAWFAVLRRTRRAATAPVSARE
jgi:hypothetical protein